MGAAARSTAMITGSLGDVRLFMVINRTYSTKVTVRIAKAVDAARAAGDLGRIYLAGTLGI
jgi:hypothetical protein